MADNMIGAFDRLGSKNLIVNQHRCVRVRNRNASCRKCADACTSGCISFEDNKLIVQEEKCVGCGTCSTVCPTCALLAMQPGDAELLRQATLAMLANGGDVVLAAQPVLDENAGRFDATKVVPVVNLGRVEETLIVSLANAGAKTVTLVQPTHMDAHEAHGLEVARMVCDTANRILEVWDNPCRAGIVAALPESVYGEFAGQTPKTFAAPESVVHTTARVERHLSVMDDGTLPHFIPDRREHLLDALYDMGDPSDETLNCRLWGHVVIDMTKCLGCRMCATFCPTGAIFKFTDEDGTTGIEHAPGDCVKCRCCEDICPADALTLSDVVCAEDVVSGAVDRYIMPPESLRRTNSHSMVNSLRGLGIKAIFEQSS